MTALIANVSFILKLLVVAIIPWAMIYALLNFFISFLKTHKTEASLNSFKQIVGRSVQVVLELLIVVDIINTIVLDATIENVLVLGMLILICTFLGWMLVLETKGQLPCQKKVQ